MEYLGLGADTSRPVFKIYYRLRRPKHYTGHCQRLAGDQIGLQMALLVDIRNSRVSQINLLSAPGGRRIGPGFVGTRRTNLSSKKRTWTSNGAIRSEQVVYLFEPSIIYLLIYR